MTGFDVLASLVAGVSAIVVSSLWFADRVLGREPSEAKERRIRMKREILQEQRDLWWNSYKIQDKKTPRDEVQASVCWQSVERLDRELMKLADEETKS